MSENDYDYNNESNYNYYSMGESKFISISSYPNEINKNSSYYNYAFSLLGTLWSKSKYAASVFREKIDNYYIGRKITFVGDKAIEIIWYTGEIVIEKGSQILVSIIMYYGQNSDTVTTITTKANDSFVFIKNKIGKTSSSNDLINAYVDIGDSNERFLLYEDKI